MLDLCPPKLCASLTAARFTKANIRIPALPPPANISLFYKLQIDGLQLIICRFAKRSRRRLFRVAALVSKVNVYFPLSVSIRSNTASWAANLAYFLTARRGNIFILNLVAVLICFTSFRPSSFARLSGAVALSFVKRIIKKFAPIFFNKDFD